MGNYFARLLGDGREVLDDNAPFPVSELLVLLALIALFTIFFVLIIYGIFKSCKNGTCSKPVESGG